MTWQKADELLYSDSHAMHESEKRIVRLPNNTLVIYNATINDSSVYECSILKRPPIVIRHRVRVEIGRPPSPTTPPTSQYKPPLIRATPAKKVEVNVGENVTLGCETRMQTKPEIKWYHEVGCDFYSAYTTHRRTWVFSLESKDQRLATSPIGMFN